MTFNDILMEHNLQSKILYILHINAPEYTYMAIDHNFN